VHPDAQEAYESLLASDINEIEEILEEIEEFMECDLILQASNELIHEDSESESV
jgi:hypothetical protein